MFTGIIESIGTLQAVQARGSALDMTFSAHLDEDLKIDQSVAHNGVCLTVVTLAEQGPGHQVYTVTAVEETLQRTQLGRLRPGDPVNLERCLRLGQRLDGHVVQGHVDTCGTLLEVEDRSGSWMVRIGYAQEWAPLLVPKGSVCVNGVSLTVVEAGSDWFSLTLIPYTWEHTTFRHLRTGDAVNLEFDILGKYFLRMQELKG